MSKRPPVDLKALTSEQAAPMPEASQRTAQPSLVGSVKTANLEALAFKVPPEFRKRFRQRRRGRRSQIERAALRRLGRLGRKTRLQSVKNSYLDFARKTPFFRAGM